MEDGGVERYSANVIAEHIYSQIDDDGNNVYLLDEIIDHRRTKEAVPRTAETDEKCAKTTKGWELLIRLLRIRPPNGTTSRT